MRIARLVFGEKLESILHKFEIPDVAITEKCQHMPCNKYLVTYPFPAKYRHCVLSSQKGMQTPDDESRLLKPPTGSCGFLRSHSPSWRSLIREKPVVAILSYSPIHVTRLFLAPGWPVTSIAGFSCRTSHIRNFLSREVVTNRDPFALQDNDCMTCVCLRVSRGDPASTSHILTV